MQNRLFQVADCILEQTKRSHREDYLNSVQSVQAFARSGLSVELSETEALRVLHACEEWVERETFGTSDDYYRIVKVPLFK